MEERTKLAVGTMIDVAKTAEEAFKWIYARFPDLSEKDRNIVDEMVGEKFAG